MNKVIESIKIPLIDLEFLLIYGYKSKKQAIKVLDEKSQKTFNKIVKKNDFDSPGCIWETTNENPIVGYHILIFPKIDYNNIHGVINHEIVHLMQNIRIIFMNGRIERELEALMHEWIYNEVSTLINERI